MSVSLEVSKREVRPRSIRNKLRHEGKIPAVVNGYKVESTPISVDAKDFSRILREEGLNTVITIKIDGNKVNTLVQEYSSDTFTSEITHVSFISVNMKEETEVDADVVLVGDAAGVKVGGILAQTLYTVTVSATPDKLPENVELDVSALEIGDSVTVADIPESDDYTILNDPEEQVASVSEPRVEEEVEEPGEEITPEVIGEDTEEE